MIFSRGNKKLPTSTLIFNLPSGITCPGMTVECNKHCYAKKAERMYPQVLPFRQRNYELTQSDTFEEEMIAELKRLKGKFTTVRIHESGDFYSAEYFRKWKTIAKEFPEITFYAYTKSFNVLSDLPVYKPKNLKIYASDDSKNCTIAELKWLKYNGRARIYRGGKLTKNEFLCPGDCKVCDYCYVGNGFKQIVFEMH